MNRCAALLFFGCALMFYADTAIAETGSQIPATTRDGKTNLTHVWLHKGGGRLYWKTLTHPLQIRLEGAQFVDPASVPVLSTNPGTDLSARQSHKKGRRSSRKSRRAQSHSQTDKAAGTGKPCTNGCGQNGPARPIHQKCHSTSGAGPQPEFRLLRSGLAASRDDLYHTALDVSGTDPSIASASW